MPHITEQRRPFYDGFIDQLVKQVEGRTNEMTIDGDINYIITRLIFKAYGKQNAYRKLKDAIGAFECAKLEFYRVVVGPYEDLKIKENGSAYAED